MDCCWYGLLYICLHIRTAGRVVNINGDKSPWDTPCVGICSTTVGGKVCTGCGRTVSEIRDWHTYTRDECQAVNRKAAGRLKDNTNDDRNTNLRTIADPYPGVQ